MNTVSFKEAWGKDLPMRVADTGAHVIVAWLLASGGLGPGWYQWIPDAVLPVLWMHGMLTDTFLPDGSFWLHVHRLLHARQGLMMALFVGVLAYASAGLPLLCHWCAHVLVDRLTHEGGWQ